MIGAYVSLRNMSVEELTFEAEKYSFPIIAVNNGNVISRNLDARRLRSLSASNPDKRLPIKERKRLSSLSTASFALTELGRDGSSGKAVVFRPSESLVYMYLPMLEPLVFPPCDLIGFGEAIGRAVLRIMSSRTPLPDAVAVLAEELIGQRELRFDSFLRICALASLFMFAEDSAVGCGDAAALIDVKSAFSLFGRALEGADGRSVGELTEPFIDIELRNGRLSVFLYGTELVSEVYASSASAVAPYSYTDDEASIALAIAILAAIMRDRKPRIQSDTNLQK